MEFVSKYNYEQQETMRSETASNDLSPTMTLQQYKDDADINNLISRYKTTGTIPTNIDGPAVERTYEFGDYVNVPNLMDYLNLMIDAQEQFDALPAKTRKIYDNDPLQLLTHVAEAQANGDIKSLIETGILTESKINKQNQEVTNTVVENSNSATPPVPPATQPEGGSTSTT